MVRTELDRRCAKINSLRLLPLITKSVLHRITRSFLSSSDCHPPFSDKGFVFEWSDPKWQTNSSPQRPMSTTRRGCLGHPRGAHSTEEPGMAEGGEGSPARSHELLSTNESCLKVRKLQVFPLNFYHSC